MKLSLPKLKSEPQTVAWLLEADKLGLIISPEETIEEFQKRLECMQQENEFVFPQDAQDVESDILSAAAQLVYEKYGFLCPWVPVKYSTAFTGKFCAGVTVIIDDKIPVVFLSGSLIKRGKFFGYTSVETLAHELVHAVRPGNSIYDEYFACQVHSSIFRRLAGNLFRRWELPLLFFLGLTLGVLFWAFLIIPALIIIREIFLLRVINRASKTLVALGLSPNPVLFRMSDSEIALLAKGLIPKCLTDSTILRKKLFFSSYCMSNRW